MRFTASSFSSQTSFASLWGEMRGSCLLGFTGLAEKMNLTALYSSKREQTMAYIFLLFCPALMLAVAGSASEDVSALLEFRKGVNDDPQGCILNTWLVEKLDSSGCPENWCGVTCIAGTVTALNLASRSLAGKINDGTIGKMQMLSYLDLSNNSFSGSLPDDLGNLASLEQMNLSGNLLNGAIPNSFGKLRQLSYLNLSFNQLNGNVPVEISSLNLTVLDLHQNKLTGNVDPLLMSFSAIRHVDLSHNKLTGTVPLQGINPPPMLSTVQYVNISYNHLSGPLVQDKDSVLFAEQLIVLDISNNQFFGQLPSFQYLYSLKILRLRNNLFSGTIPPVLFTTMSMEELDLSKNNLSGEISTVTSVTLRYLNISSNSLYGSIPLKLGSCITVDLSNNKFTGDLSKMNEWGDSLEFLDLSRNNLMGFLPNQTAQFVRLTYLNLSHNQLSGLVPASLGLFPKLTFFDLSFNALNGTIPPILLNSSTLSYLSLSHNDLSGNIPLQPSLSSASGMHVPLPFNVSGSPTQINQIPSIQVLELSNNKLNGRIPDAISLLQSLVTLDLSNNELSGNIPNALCDLTFLQVLYLSENQLSGSIPNALPQSLKKLNLSDNNLSGTIPSNLGNFSASSFFPGNIGLTARNSRFPWGNPSSPKGGNISLLQPHHRGIGTSVKSGLIGGCTLALVLIVAISLLLYYKNLSKPPEYGKGPEFGNLNNKDAGKTHRLWSPCAAYFAFHDNGSSVPPVMSFPADLLLAAEKMAPSDRLQELTREGDLWRKDLETGEDLSKRTGIEMSPSRTWHKSFSGPSSGSNNHYDSSSQAEESLASESPVILKVQSPDRLAGDLYFLDITITFSAEELSRAPAEVLGRSSHGTSYKATLDNGHTLTVKWLREGLAKGRKDFAKGAKKMGKIRHPNVIPLRAYYWGPREHEKLILSDYISSGSLAAHLCERMTRRFSPLSWQQRLMIVVDIARGLVYLHTDRHLPHGNLKATNVLLDDTNLNGQLADYSLHLLMTSEGTANQILNAGALGYRAPELSIMKRPKPSYKGDVYAFGVIMLEILTGKGAGDIISGHCGAVDLTDWVRLLATEGRTIECFDPALVGTERHEESPKGMDEMLALALKCIASQSERPNIRSVYQDLTSIST